MDVLATSSSVPRNSSIFLAVSPISLFCILEPGSRSASFVESRADGELRGDSFEDAESVQNELMNSADITGLDQPEDNLGGRWRSS